MYALNMFQNALIIGYGSIGKKHAAHLIKYFKKVFIYDPLKTVDEFYFTRFEFVSNLTRLAFHPDSQDIAVIANWGPDHLGSFEICLGLGFKNFVLEKPLTSSLTDLIKLRTLIKTRNVNVLVNQGWESEKLGIRIRKLGFNLDLGEPVAMFVSGGARCISTAGSHNIHLALGVFDSVPIEMMGHLKDDRINPRNSELAYYEGTYSIIFEQGQRLSMSYSNKSSVQGRVEIYWRDAYGELINEAKVRIFERDYKRPYANIITRYGIPDKLVWDDITPSEEPQILSAFQKMYRGFQNLTLSEFQRIFERHFISNEALLRTLISSDQGKVIRMNQPIDEAWSEMDFRIS